MCAILLYCIIIIIIIQLRLEEWTVPRAVDSRGWDEWNWYGRAVFRVADIYEQNASQDNPCGRRRNDFTADPTLAVQYVYIHAAAAAAVLHAPNHAAFIRFAKFATSLPLIKNLICFSCNNITYHNTITCTCSDSGRYARNLNASAGITIHNIIFYTYVRHVSRWFENTSLFYSIVLAFFFFFLLVFVWEIFNCFSI